MYNIYVSVSITYLFYFSIALKSRHSFYWRCRCTCWSCALLQQRTGRRPMSYGFSSIRWSIKCLYCRKRSNGYAFLLSSIQCSTIYISWHGCSGCYNLGSFLRNLVCWRRWWRWVAIYIATIYSPSVIGSYVIGIKCVHFRRNEIWSKWKRFPTTDGVYMSRSCRWYWW